MRWLWIGLLFMIAPVYAEHAEELFLQANELYKHHQTEKALTTYQAIAYKGEAVWHNMGNCAYHLGYYDRALLYWRRAQRYAFLRNYYILENYIRQVHAISKNDLPFTWLDNVATLIVGVMRYISCLAWQLVFIGCLSILGMFAYFSQRRRRLIMIMMSICFILGLLGMLAHYLVAMRMIGVITAQEVALHVGKDEQFKIIKKFMNGQELVLLERDGTWLKVRDKTTTGWVTDKAVEIV